MGRSPQAIQAAMKTRPNSPHGPGQTPHDSKLHRQQASTALSPIAPTTNRPTRDSGIAKAYKSPAIDFEKPDAQWEWD